MDPVLVMRAFNPELDCDTCHHREMQDLEGEQASKRDPKGSGVGSFGRKCQVDVCLVDE